MNFSSWMRIFSAFRCVLLPEVFCFRYTPLNIQEVDRLATLLPMLDQAGYSHRYAAGRGKKHGCLIAFKRRLLEKIHERLIYYDEQPIRDAEDERGRRGHSHETKNIGLILALRFREDPSNGVIIATTHLFWHPKCASLSTCRQIINSLLTDILTSEPGNFISPATFIYIYSIQSVKWDLGKPGS